MRPRKNERDSPVDALPPKAVRGRLVKVDKPEMAVNSGDTGDGRWAMNDELPSSVVS
jgi:hypothetical protein